MTTALQYHARKAAGLCPGCGQRQALPGYVHCEPCSASWTLPATRAHMALVREALGSHVFLPLAPASRDCSDPEAPGPNVVAHCGTWHAITAAMLTDARCPRCGRGWLEASETSA